MYIFSSVIVDVFSGKPPFYSQRIDVCMARDGAAVVVRGITEEH